MQKGLTVCTSAILTCCCLCLYAKFGLRDTIPSISVAPHIRPVLQKRRSWCDAWGGCRVHAGGGGGTAKIAAKALKSRSVQFLFFIPPKCQVLVSTLTVLLKNIRIDSWTEQEFHGGPAAKDIRPIRPCAAGSTNRWIHPGVYCA